MALNEEWLLHPGTRVFVRELEHSRALFQQAVNKCVRDGNSTDAARNLGCAEALDYMMNLLTRGKA